MSSSGTTAVGATAVMNCEQTRKRLGGYLYDEINAPDRRRLEAHLANCAGCRRELETEQRFVSALARKMRGISEDVTR
jgi:anti-sigma factor RsiW